MLPLRNAVKGEKSRTSKEAIQSGKGAGFHGFCDEKVVGFSCFNFGFSFWLVLTVWGWVQFYSFCFLCIGMKLLHFTAYSVADFKSLNK